MTVRLSWCDKARVESGIITAEAGRGLASAGYDEYGRPRTAGSAASASVELGLALGGRGAAGAAGLPGVAGAPGAAGASAAASPAPQITVNVQAMDARSFMDRSGDIALAVRDAMLNLNSINDVFNEL